jgi:hypothetical protein
MMSLQRSSLSSLGIQQALRGSYRLGSRRPCGHRENSRRVREPAAYAAVEICDYPGEYAGRFDRIDKG